MAPSRVLVVSTDPVTEQLPGPAIRALHLAEVLATEHEVVLASTVAATRQSPSLRIVTARDPAARSELAAWMDVAVVPAGLFHEWPEIAHTDRVVVVDIYDPYHLENLEPGADLSQPDRNAHVARLTEAISAHVRRGDFFLCASERQRDFWLGTLTALGRVNPYTYDDDATLSSLIAVVPFGLSANKPVAAGSALRGSIDGVGPDDKVILWAGGVYNWFDPCSLIHAIDSLRTTVDNVRLIFLGMRHPNPAIPAMRTATEARALADRLGLTGKHVFFNENWVAYDERAAALLDADIGVSIHLDHVETRYSFRTRILDYLWCRLPMVLTEGDVLADTVREAGLGVTVPPGDVDAIERGVARMLTTPPADSRFAPVASSFEWSKVAAPLIEFCREPRRAPDLVAQSAGTGTNASEPRSVMLRRRAVAAMRRLRPDSH